MTNALRSATDRFGLSCASVTPFAASGAVDVPRLIAHLQRCQAEGCDSFMLFGTTGEGASVGLAERNLVLESAIDAFGGDSVLVGIAASAPADAAAQANPLFDAGGRGALLAPPFFFKGIGDEGLYRWFSRAIEAMHAPRGVFLYHLPSVTQVPLSLSLIGRLREAFPEVVAGVKDSGGDWPYTERLLAAHGDAHILVGDERFLARAMRHGASGAINGVSNFCARRLRPLIERGEEDAGLCALVELLLEAPVIPGIKTLVAHVAGDKAFARVAPPLAELPAAQATRLIEAFEALGR